MKRCLLIIVLILAMASSATCQDIAGKVVETPTVTKVAATGHNPTKALLLSIIPGGGQIYNGQAWKVPIFYAALGGVGYMTYSYYTNMKMFKNEYLRIGYNGSSDLPDYKNYPGSSIYNLYQSNNKNFQLFVIISTAVYGFNLLDAYVFGHLYDFEVSDDLSLRVSPSVAPDMGSPLGFSPAINMSITF